MPNRLILHIGFWSVYVLIHVYTNAELTNPSYLEKSFAFRAGKALMGELLVLPIKMGLTYVILYYFIPFFDKKLNIKWLVQLLVAIFMTLTLYRCSIAYVIRPLVFDTTAAADNFSIARYLWAAIDVFSIVGIAVALKLFRLRQAEKERAQALEKQRLESELQFLRSQTNPHFLFNTLNNIYALARKQSEQTASVVLKLSKILRFMLYECSTPVISIQTEIQIIEDYLALEKLRYPERLKVRFCKKIDTESAVIAPLLLLPLVENAFKHGVSETRFASYVHIDLQIKDQQLNFKVCNNQEGAAEQTSETGIGLKNIQRQLELIYPQRHQMQVQNAIDFYQVQLNVQLYADT